MQTLIIYANNALEVNTVGLKMVLMVYKETAKRAMYARVALTLLDLSYLQQVFLLLALIS